MSAILLAISSLGRCLVLDASVSCVVPREQFENFVPKQLLNAAGERR